MISVVICTHNPRPAMLVQVLDALRAQTLPRSEWELLLIDNASSAPLAPLFDISWHPRGRHVQEPQLGLVRARLRSISEAAGDLLVFVDDDNVVAPDYLDRATEIARDYPFLGAWGGRILCDYAVPPAPWMTGYLGMLGRDVTRDIWSNLTQTSVTTPYGAGMCVRAVVARKYAERVQTSALRQKLGRNGKDLSAAEDIDLAYTGCDLGFGNGLFASLSLRHLIPAERLTADYFVRLAEAMAFSEVVLQFLWSGTIHDPAVSKTDRIFRYYRELRQGPRIRAVERARRRGHHRAADFLRSLPPE
jgi:hypothetical protein